MHKVKNVVSVSPWKARMKHVFKLTVLIPNAHVMAREATRMHSVESLFSD